MWRLASGCPQLRSLNLRWCRAVTDAAVGHLAAACPDLDSLCLDHCNAVTDLAVRTLGSESRSCSAWAALSSASHTLCCLLAGRCRSLSRLSLVYCQQLTDDCLQPLTDSGACPRLHTLILDHCDAITVCCLVLRCLCDADLCALHCLSGCGGAASEQARVRSGRSGGVAGAEPPQLPARLVRAPQAPHDRGRVRATRAHRGAHGGLIENAL